MKFEYLENVATADIAFKAKGKSLNELFENSALATTQTMVELKTVKQKIIKEVSLKTDDIEQLLFEFLSEIIFLQRCRKSFFSKFEVKIMGNSLKAKMFGEEYGDTIKYLNDVKAITMHMLKVEQKDKVFIQQ